MAKRRPDLQRSPGWHWLTRIAFALTLALVIARMLTTESLRSPAQAVPGEQAPPLGPGAATGLVFDLLGMIPALLVLGRASFDTTFRLRWSWAAGGFLLLGLWALASTLWSADRFAAVVSSMHWLGAMVLLWSTLQLVDSWLRLRILGGVCLALLMALVLTGYYFRLVEWRDLRTAWETNRAEILREHNWTSDSFEARQFEKRILSGSTMGFSASPNTYAALLVLLGIVSTGAALSRSEDRDGIGWAVAPAFVICAAIPVLIWAGSRGAAGTAVLAAILFAVCGSFPARLRARARSIYWYSLGGMLFLAAAIVSHGLRHGTLFHDSLTFRWRYWVGSARLIAAHPLLGVGWENFGPRYLAFRLPIASEEIRDPHNFFVRIVAELGIIGGVLIIVAMLRLAWESTLPAAREPDLEVPDADWSPRKQRRLATQRVLLIATLAIAINFFASVDLASNPSYVLIEFMRRALFWLLLVVGISAVSLRAPATSQRNLREDELEYFSDARRSPWLLYAMLIGLGMFLIHNLIDFALFEPGPMFLFALLAGGVLGMRQPKQQSAPRWRMGTACVSVLALLGWLAATIFIMAPVAMAESLVHEADDAIRGNRPALAVRKLESAFDLVPYNSDYAFRAAILRANEHDLNTAHKLLSSAIAADSAIPDTYVWRAQLTLALPHQDAAASLADMATAVSLDPNSVDLHKRYAQMLEQVGDEPAASREYAMALKVNEGLDPHDPKRLSAEAVKALQNRASSR